MKANVNRPAITVAAIVAVSLLFITGGISWAIRPYLPTEPTGDGEKMVLSLLIGNWEGHEIPVAPKILEAADVGYYVSNEYRRSSERASLWVAHGVRGRDLAPHRPEVCLPGSGYTLIGHTGERLSLSDGSVLECSVYRFAKGLFDSRKVQVLHYYIIDGQYHPTLAFWLRPKLALAGGIRSLTSVQVVVAENDIAGPDAALKTARDFATASGPVIRSAISALVAGTSGADETAESPAHAAQSHGTEH